MLDLMRKSSESHRRVAAAVLCGTAVFTFAACGDDDPNQNVPASPAGTVFGTAAPVDNSTDNGNYTPVQSVEVPPAP